MVFISEAEDETNFVIQLPGEPRSKFIDGKKWPSNIRAANLRSAKRYVPEADDVFVVTFPKCGTTWTQNICMQLLRSDYTPDNGKELYKASPMIEVKGAKVTRDTPRPCVIKTHFNYSDIPKGPDVRYLFVARNPKDVCISYYFHTISMEVQYNWKHGTFEEFFQLFFDGRLEYGDYFDYMLEWLAHFQDENMMVIKYEDMVRNLPTAVKKIAKFLGGSAKKAVATKAKLNKIVSSCSFDEMSREQHRFCPLDNENHRFFRKGQNKDWINYFTKEQSDYVDKLWKERMAGTLMEHWWTEEMKWESHKQDFEYLF